MIRRNSVFSAFKFKVAGVFLSSGPASFTWSDKEGCLFVVVMKWASVGGGITSHFSHPYIAGNSNLSLSGELKPVQTFRIGIIL